MNEYIRLCPSCGKEIKYKNKSHCIRADIKNSICQECQQKKYQSIEKFIRNCPICDKEIKYKDNISYERSIKKDRPCLSCYSKIGEYENKTNIRNCPICNKKIIYSNKYKCNYANLKKSECRSCSKSGEKAPLYGRIGEKHHNFGIKLTDEQKQKMRLSKMAHLKKCYGQLSPFYNPLACQYFNKLMEETNTHIQHAENGGEFYIPELGYWVDGYDEINNAIYEFDERHHFDAFGNLKDKDIRRQNEIVKLLKCQFHRIKFNMVS
jgi:hypothetical protein